MTARFWLRVCLALTALLIGWSGTSRIALAVPIIANVQPGTVNNTASVNLAVTGSGFITGSIVILNGYGALDTTRASDALLTAALPAGVPPGVYSLSVVNTDGTATLNNALTVLGPTATPAPTSFVRPVLVVQSYGASSTALVAGQDLDFEMTLVNAGQATATNVILTFRPGDLIPRVTGGVRALPSLAPGQSARVFQPFTASSAIAGQRLASLEVNVSYTTAGGDSYTETFTLTFDVARPITGPAATLTPTATAGAAPRPQLLVAEYRTDVAKLQPGAIFTLEMEVENVGNAAARRVSLIVGGGATTSSPSGTPGPGGVSGGGGEFTNFAPLGASNVQSLGELPAGGRTTARQTLIVNSTTKAGAYPMKLSFVYVDAAGSAVTDDQVITLLVYQLPQLEISFYRPPDPLFAFQPNALPIQVVNAGRTTSLLGNLKVTAAGGEFSNNVLFVGNLDPGGSFPLDAVFIPSEPGPVELIVSVDYTDDFGQRQTITAVLPMEVLESEPPPVDGGPIDGGFPPPEQPETLWEMFVRFIKGLLGLGSGRAAPSGGQGGVIVEPGMEGPMRGP